MLKYSVIVSATNLASFSVRISNWVSIFYLISINIFFIPIVDLAWRNTKPDHVGRNVYEQSEATRYREGFGTIVLLLE